jgi:hypothetical protein
MLEKIITFINADAGTMATAIAKMTLFIVLSLRSLPQRPRFSLYIPRSAMSGRVLFRFCFEKKIRSWGLGASSSSKRGLCKASNLRTSKFWFVLGLRCSELQKLRARMGSHYWVQQGTAEDADADTGGIFIYTHA